MFDQRTAEFMQRVVAQKKESVSLGVTARRIHEDFALGNRKGKTIYFSANDREEMKILLISNGHAMVPVAKEGLSRSDLLASGVPNEKAGGSATKSERVSVKALAGQPLLLGDAVTLPERCHLDASWPTIAPYVRHTSIMVVENYEVFDQVHRVRFSLPEIYGSPLVLYRGDRNESRNDNVLAFIEACDLPVLAFVDIDPMGLLIAASLPRLDGIVAPEREILETLLESPATGRRDLFQQQYPVAGASLNALPSSHCALPLWAMVSRYRAGVVQERWIASDACCRLWI